MNTLSEQIADRIRCEHRKYHGMDWPRIAAQKLLSTPEFRVGWIPLEGEHPKPLLGQTVDVWVVLPPEHRYPAMKPYRVTGLTVTATGIRCGVNGPVQYHITHWMPTPVAPSDPA